MKKSFWLEIGIFATKGVLLVGILLLFVVGAGALYELEEYISDGVCNVAVLPLEGVVLPYQGLLDVPLVITPSLVHDFVAKAEADPSIEAILLEVDSSGGTPVASERIAERIQTSDLPVVGLIGDQGASGGYLIAAATDYLVASAMSDVGSIGVDMSYVEESERNEDEGLTYVQLTAGEYKDIGSPNRPITDEERAILQASLDQVHEHFIGLVADYRNLDRVAVAEVADGTTLNGSQAATAGLIDAVGGRTAAREALASMLERNIDDIVLCEYEPPIFAL